MPFNHMEMKMKQNPRSHILVVVLAAAFTAMPLSQSASAASQCKGLDIKACDAQASCTWIKSYQTKKGSTINAYCRTKPVNKSSKETTKTDAASGDKSS